MKRTFLPFTAPVSSQLSPFISIFDEALRSQIRSKECFSLFCILYSAKSLHWLILCALHFQIGIELLGTTYIGTQNPKPASDILSFLARVAGREGTVLTRIYREGEWELVSLQRIVNRALSDVGRPVCLFLDGLDEFSGDNEEQLDLALFLADLPSRGSIKVCIASRPHDIMNRVFGSGPLLDMQDWNLPGLTKYVFRAFEKMGLASNQSDAAQAAHLSELMGQMAEGVFLWTRFAVQDIIELWKRQELEFASLLLRLAELPREVEALWDRRREQLSKSERELGSVLLRTACSAARPLSVVELLDVSQRQSPSQDSQTLGGSAQDLSKLILRLSCGLLELKEDTSRKTPGYQTVLLVHKSVRRYIETNGWWVPRDEPKVPEQMWLEECATILDNATFARERSLCFQHKPHDVSNPVCKSYGCYEKYPPKSFPKALYAELHGGIERAINPNTSRSLVRFFADYTFSLLRRQKLTFIKLNMASSLMLAYAFHWFAYHAWILEKRRRKPYLPATNLLMCPELIVLMSQIPTSLMCVLWHP